VLLVPVGEAPHKEIAMDPGPRMRYELCRLAAAGDKRLEVSRAEIDREGPSYTVDTLLALREVADYEALYLIIGGDEAAALADWRGPERVLELANVAVAEREDAMRDRVLASVAALDGGDRVEFFSMPRVDISSSLVRERVGAGRPIRYLVPEAVAVYIEEKGLYSAVGERAS
jgi:nicotinate-nucleotide adenylyltransferase